MKQRNNYYEDKFERKARAQERHAFREKRQSQSYKYNVEDDEDFDTAETGVMPNKSNFKRKQNGY